MPAARGSTLEARRQRVGPPAPIARRGGQTSKRPAPRESAADAPTSRGEATQRSGIHRASQSISGHRAPLDGIREQRRRRREEPSHRRRRRTSMGMATLLSNRHALTPLTSSSTVMGMHILTHGVRPWARARRRGAAQCARARPQDVSRAHPLPPRAPARHRRHPPHAQAGAQSQRCYRRREFRPALAARARGA